MGSDCSSSSQLLISSSFSALDLDGEHGPAGDGLEGLDQVRRQRRALQEPQGRRRQGQEASALIRLASALYALLVAVRREAL